MQLSQIPQNQQYALRIIPVGRQLLEQDHLVLSIFQDLYLMLM